jgi:glucose-1-phosphate thymidylyltransferase
MEKNDYGQYLLEIAKRKHTRQYWDQTDQHPMIGMVK